MGCFRGNEPNIVQGAQPSWNFPLCAGSTAGCSTIAGYFYTQFAAPPKAGQTLTITFNVRATNPVWQQRPASGGNSETDINPPTLHVFPWRKGDNLSCQGGYADYRLFAGRTPLVAGDNQTITVTLDAASWAGCYGKNPANMQDILSNLLGVGVTFGGQWFAGHGIYLSGGSASFTVTRISVE